MAVWYDDRRKLSKEDGGLQALSIAFHAIVPLFLIIAVGYAVKRLGWIGPEEVRRFNKVTFYTFMPVMLFYNIYTSDFSQAVRAPYVVFVVGMALGMVLLSFVITLLVEKIPQRRGVMIQAAFRSNFVLLGLPIAMELLPEGNFGVTALMIAIVVPIYNVLSVVVLEYFRGGRPKPGAHGNHWRSHAEGNLQRAAAGAGQPRVLRRGQGGRRAHAHGRTGNQ